MAGFHQLKAVHTLPIIRQPRMATKLTLRPTILVEDKRWRLALPTFRADVTRAFRATAEIMGEGRQMPQTILSRASASVAFSNDMAMRRLNHTYRAKNKPTNVLSFTDGSIDNNMLSLGDIVLSYETIVKEASQQRKSLADHTTHLVVHGLLHLIGYDHEMEEEAEEMETVEVDILRSLRIENPYK